MLSIIAQSNARAKLPMTSDFESCKDARMRDWVINYIHHILEARNWSANRLAKEAGLATSTIARPLRELDYNGKLSRVTVAKLHAASGIDPAAFVPEGFAEDVARYSGPRPQNNADIVLQSLDKTVPSQNSQAINEIKIAVVGSHAQIVATINREGLAKLRQKLDAIEAMLDD